jgi:tRNA(fMet)-specific endonuclease VapC
VRADSKYTELVKAKVRVGTKDLRIASIALVNNATVLTRNVRDFGKVPGLLTEDWTT